MTLNIISYKYKIIVIIFPAFPGEKAELDTKYK